VGLPLIFWFLKEKITFSVVNEFTKDISFFSKRAEIIISGVGKPKLIKEKMIKKGVIIIDIGTSFKNGKLMGDVDFEKVAKKTLAITPVPGGIGPLVVASLIENLVKNKF
jgi:methylenetetrahydrofolate dehydrogenase (NADP+)/methenyltetrahydrofolate cyclohydrolase